MIACVDVDYQAAYVTAGCVGFEAWTDEIARIEVVIRTLGAPQPYQPGAFYERELPSILTVLERMPPLELVIIDAYVWLGVDQPGLGMHVHDARKLPVIGVAKTRFAGANAIEVVRGGADRPLYITAVGIDEQLAADHIRSMHGDHRIPTLIRRADALARGR